MSRVVSSWRVVVLLLFVLGGCGGGEDDVASCEMPDTGAASGDLDGWNGEVVRAFYSVGEDVGETAYVVGLDTGTGACGEASDAGDHLLLIWLSAPPAEGTFEIGAAGAPFALFENDGPQDENVAESGTVVVDSISADCVGGSFELDFPGDTLGGHVTGSFAAAVCQ